MLASLLFLAAHSPQRSKLFFSSLFSLCLLTSDSEWLLVIANVYLIFLYKVTSLKKELLPIKRHQKSKMTSHRLDNDTQNAYIRAARIWKIRVYKEQVLH